MCVYVCGVILCCCMLQQAPNLLGGPQGWWVSANVLLTWVQKGKGNSAVLLTSIKSLVDKGLLVPVMGVCWFLQAFKEVFGLVGAVQYHNKKVHLHPSVVFSCFWCSVQSLCGCHFMCCLKQYMH